MPSGANNTKDSVRELQVKLYLAAKRSPGRRFHVGTVGRRAAHAAR
jgi:hypothetical protein